MKNMIIWGLTPILGFFLGAFAAGILEAAWNFAPIDFGTTASNVLIMLGMIPGYLIAIWVESKVGFLYEEKKTEKEVEAMIEEIGVEEKPDLWENERFVENKE